MTKTYDPLPADVDPMSVSDAQWKERLTPEAFKVTRKHGTERAFSHPYNAEKRDGVFSAACAAGSRFFRLRPNSTPAPAGRASMQPIDESAVSDHEDRSFFMRRVENRCSRCDAHLGHVFSDGPQPTGLRYCMNGAALHFEPESES
jgi:peptide-methionine (R)-S-oxide reductase